MRVILIDYALVPSVDMLQLITRIACVAFTGAQRLLPAHRFQAFT